MTAEDEAPSILLLPINQMDAAECIASIYETCRAPDCPFSDSSREAVKCLLSGTAPASFARLDWPQPPNDDGWAAIDNTAGDLLVGFFLAPEYAGSPPTVEMRIGEDLEVATGGAPLQPVQLAPGQVRFALEGRYAVPLVCMQIQRVYVRLSAPAARPHCKLIGAYLQDDPRVDCVTARWTGTFRSGRPFVVGAGWLCVVVAAAPCADALAVSTTLPRAAADAPEEDEG